MRKSVILGIIAELIRDKKALVVENLVIETPKTKKADEILNNVKAEGKISVIFSENDKNAYESFRNIAGVHIMSPNRLDMINLISSNQLVMSKDAIEDIEKVYTSK